MTRAALIALAALALAAPAAAASTGAIFTFAGTTPGLGGDGMPAADAQLALPSGVAALPDGGYLIADTENHRIRRVSREGTIMTVAGTSQGLSGDDGPATAAQLSFPSGVAALPGGGFLIADTVNVRIRRVGPDGTITTVAGTTRGPAGDGGPAVAAQLDSPMAVAVTADGGFLIADADNARIRRVGPDGTISTVAGTSAGFGGDGGQATAAQLDFPTGVAVTADGGFLIADADNERIRRVAPDGTITTVAGTTLGSSGDGGPATSAQLSFPAAVAVTADGGFLIADASNNRIRRVSVAGTITTVAGSGAGGLAGDGGPATAAQLDFPSGVAATVDGGLLIADAENHRVRFVDIDLRGSFPGPPGAPGPQGPGGPPGGGGPTGPTGPEGPAGPEGPGGTQGPDDDPGSGGPEGGRGSGGPDGTTGGGGPGGGAGPAGTAGPPAARLVLALPAVRFTAGPRRPVTLRYAASAVATVEVRVLRGRRTVARARGRARPGSNAVRLRAPRRAGPYRIALVATSADGQRATASARLRVSRRVSATGPAASA